jgi:hypothetical protein
MWDAERGAVGEWGKGGLSWEADVGWGRRQAARITARAPGLGSVKPHSVAFSDRGVCRGAGCVPSLARRPSSGRSTH